ncbi:MAG: glycosyltransferase [Holophagales bacterium]|nr:glycosyltransferase [Holophagales bacterium]
MLISLAMIVKNEEGMLAHCLESVKALVDEIIVVDTGSTDKTIDIAREFGARVYPFKWCDDFSAARNESLKYCKGDWVLILDADEAIDALDHEKIKNACQRPQADAYNLIHRNYAIKPDVSLQDIALTPNVSDYSEGRELPFYADIPVPRLVKMFDGLTFNSRVHETYEASLIPSRKTTKNLDAVIHHYGKLLAEREEYKAQYYLMLARLEAEANPDFAPVHLRLLQQALRAKHWETALEAAKASIKLALAVDSFVLYGGRSAQEAIEANIKLAIAVDPFILYGGGLALQNMDRHAEAIGYFDMLLSQHPQHALAWLGKGHSCWALGDFSAAREAMMKAIELQPGSAMARKRLAELEYAANNAANNLDAARRATLEAIDMAPNEPALYDNLLKIEMARDNTQQAVQDALLAIRKCPGGGEGRWHRLAAVYLYQNGQRDTAVSVLELGLKNFPNDPDLMRLRGMI